MISASMLVSEGGYMIEGKRQGSSMSLDSTESILLSSSSYSDSYIPDLFDEIKAEADKLDISEAEEKI